MGYFPGGSIAKYVILYLCAKFGAFTINPTIPSYFCTNLPDYSPDEVFSIDACLAGCGGVCDDQYFHAFFTAFYF